jgi:hypothetical protein
MSYDHKIQFFNNVFGTDAPQDIEVLELLKLKMTEKPFASIGIFAFI